MIREKSQRQTVWKMVLVRQMGEQDIVETREGKSRQRAMWAQKGANLSLLRPGNGDCAILGKSYRTQTCGGRMISNSCRVVVFVE